MEWRKEIEALFKGQNKSNNKRITSGQKIDPRMLKIGGIAIAAVFALWIVMTYWYVFLIAGLVALWIWKKKVPHKAEEVKQ